jgi:decaprenylphospho-beta-D-erythro-pentofuranosid-2-ulose 2-reductase
MRILILGASSLLAHEAAKNFARDGAELVLVARSPQKLAAVQGDLCVRGAKAVETIEADLADVTRHQDLIEAALKPFSGLDAVLIAYGTLGDQQQSERNVQVALQEFHNNCEQQGRGCIAVISSVAGDRGRQSNYVYGAAKGALTIFSQGLRNRLAKKGVAVVTIKPGMVDTPMTAHMRKGRLFADPKIVGQEIYQAIVKRKDVVYVPAYWRYIMWIIKSIPESRFKKMNIGG